MATLSATNGQMAKRIGVTAPLSIQNYFVQVDVSLQNTGEDVPLTGSPSVFALETSNLLLYPGRTAPVDSTVGCPPEVEIERGGTLACQMTFEVPKRATVQRLLYTDASGRTASASITSVQPAPSLCTLLSNNSQDCASCIPDQERGCSELATGADAAAACSSFSCVSLAGCPTISSGCTPSTACLDAIDNLEACDYDACARFCE